MKYFYGFNRNNVAMYTNGEKKIINCGIICDSDYKINTSLIKRCGIIPYTIIDDVRYFCFGSDFKTKDITDLAGGRKLNETPFESARREFNEESLGVFENYYCDFKNRIRIYNDNNYIIFIKFIINDIEEVKKNYLERLSKINFSETSDLIWISEKDLIKELYSGKFYTITKNTLLNVIKSNADFYKIYIK